MISLHMGCCSAAARRQASGRRVQPGGVRPVLQGHGPLAARDGGEGPRRAQEDPEHGQPVLRADDQASTRPWIAAIAGVEAVLLRNLFGSTARPASRRCSPAYLEAEYAALAAADRRTVIGGTAGSMWRQHELARAAFPKTRHPARFDAGGGARPRHLVVDREAREAIAAQLDHRRRPARGEAACRALPRRHPGHGRLAAGDAAQRRHARAGDCRRSSEPIDRVFLPGGEKAYRRAGQCRGSSSISRARTCPTISRATRPT